MRTDTNTIIHHNKTDKPATTSVTFDLHAHHEGEPDEWGALRINLFTSNGSGGHLTSITHILTSADWRARAAAIRQAFRSATLQP